LAVPQRREKAENVLAARSEAKKIPDNRRLNVVYFLMPNVGPGRVRDSARMPQRVFLDLRATMPDGMCAIHPDAIDRLE
jgi:hypothetical protein